MTDFSVCVVGMGKAGLPLTCVIADSNLSTFGLDIDKKRIEDLNNKINPIPEEPGVQEILEKHVGKNLNFSSSYEEVKDKVNAYIVIVPLFIDDNKKCDFSILESAFSEVGKVLKKGDLVVLETTVPPGTTETLIRNTLEQASGLSADGDFFLAYSPERIMTGYSISRYKEFPKVVSGLNDVAAERVHELYSHYCDKVNKVSSLKTAEMIKVGEGVYRDVNIGLANELLVACEKLGVDFWEMREYANHNFCHIHEAGNVGGHCIPVYPWFLINEMDVPLIKNARLLNDNMVDYYVNKVLEISSSGKVGVVGLSYREGVKENAYTRSIPMIEALKKKGFEVYGLDPMYNENETKEIFDVPLIEDFNEMDAIVLMNKNLEYEKQLLTIKSKVVDVKNILTS